MLLRCLFWAAHFQLYVKSRSVVAFVKRCMIPGVLRSSSTLFLWDLSYKFAKSSNAQWSWDLCDRLVGWYSHVILVELGRDLKLIWKYLSWSWSTGAWNEKHVMLSYLIEGNKLATMCHACLNPNPCFLLYSITIKYYIEPKKLNTFLVKDSSLHTYLDPFHLSKSHEVYFMNLSVDIKSFFWIGESIWHFLISMVTQLSFSVVILNIR